MQHSLAARRIVKAFLAAQQPERLLASAGNRLPTLIEAGRIRSLDK